MSNSLRQRLEALYRCDGRGRTLTLNQWDDGVPPRLHLQRALGGGTLCKLRHDLPDDLAAALMEQCALEPELTEPQRLPAVADRCLALLSECASVQDVRTGPVFGFPQSLVESGSTVLVEPDDAGLLRGMLDEWLPDVGRRRPFVAALGGRLAVAVCASSRMSDGAHEAGVETHPAHRRRGYASAAVARWAQEVRECGARPFYSTTWDNAGSRALAARLGLELVAVDFSVT